MKHLGLALLATALVAAILSLVYHSQASEIRTVRPAQPALTPMLADLNISVEAPRTGARTEVRVVRFQGLVTATGGVASTARVELGLKSGSTYVASKTITIRVGEEFSETVDMPGDGPYTCYAGVVRFSSIVQADDVALRPREGRDLATGTRASALIDLTDDRGRRLDGRVTVFQRGSLLGERWTVAGRAQTYDLAPGEYIVNATALDGRAGSRTIRVTSEGNATYIISVPSRE